MSHYVPSLGTVSHGTLRTQDLIAAFAAEVRRVAPREQVEEAAALATLTEAGWPGLYDTPQADDLANALHDLLNDYAPLGLCFGSREGDGADFGWWPVEED